MDAVRQELRAKIDLSRSRVENRPRKLFFCGGKVSDVSHPTCISVRDCVVRYLHDSGSDLADGIVLAEEIQEWLHHAHYDDLVTFERHLAHLACTIVLFVESPGSIAELGAFSQVPQISDKLLVFMRNDQYEQDSFIQLGPLRLLEKKYEETRVSVYPWIEYARVENNTCSSVIDHESLDSLVEDISGDIQEFFSHKHKSAIFRQDDAGHVMLLMVDLIDMFLALKKNEILEILGDLGISIDEADLAQYLFLLETLEFVGSKKYSGSRYYFSSSDIRYVEYGVREGQRKINRVRVKASLSDYYAESDKKRSRALKAIRS